MTRPPNVLYLHSHDTGRYVEPYGYPVPTPNIQQLANQGIVFREAFCAVPTCSGSRAALLTGQYGHNSLLLSLGWGERRIRSEQLYELALDPGEATNLVEDPEYRDVRADLAARLERWMRETGDPLRHGPIAPPWGVELNLPDQVSPSEPTVTVT